jgi:4-hydroxybenzoate polyprenyltransferase
MQQVKDFFRLIRWVNLVFIIVTQAIFFYCIVEPIFYKAALVPNLKGIHFWLLVISYVSITAGGNIINDYFDLNIDLVNKPQKVVVDKTIKRRWVIVWHILLSIVAISLGFYLDKYTGIKFLGWVNLFWVLVLFLYSASLKKKFLIGNVVIAAGVAWIVFVVTFCESNQLLAVFRGEVQLQLKKISQLTFIYGGFAFIICLIREVVKDMEDIEGDRRYGCKTMPIVWGINASKVFTAVWLIVLMATIVLALFFAIQLKYWLLAPYMLIAVLIPSFIAFRLLYQAQTSQQFHKVSTWVKVIMFTGILSMLFFRLYA